VDEVVAIVKAAGAIGIRRKRPLARRTNHLIASAMFVEARGREEHDLEGIVVKRNADPYRGGVHWWKIKNLAYSQADDGRGKLLNGDRRTIPPMMRRSRASLSPS
jgi:hypothetical protein